MPDASQMCASAVVQLVSYGAGFIGKGDGATLVQMLYTGAVTVTFPNEAAVRNGPDPKPPGCTR